ncbi:MAG: hypothetical protein IPK02_01015 [Candidatus Accumulibacter sp.]|uniref:Uncharacterized protein n=1 Tax=Candidatus Accumulibacter affinis TaxID=2954384 RepID=A0A935W1V5_9PROT|nr:hypothetical protein [Candidatus Accumulibacter affinis]
MDTRTSLPDNEATTASPESVNLAQNMTMSSFELQIRDPWTLPYLRMVGALIDALHMQIGRVPPASLHEFAEGIG